MQLIKKQSNYQPSYDKSADTVDTLKIKDILKDSLDCLSIRLESYDDRIDDLEYISRSGFSAYASNRGGIDYISYSDILSISGSGIGPKELLEYCYKQELQAITDLKVEHPDLSEDEIQDELYNYMQDSIAFRVRMIYRGNGRLEIFTGFDLDGPYFRFGSLLMENEFVVNFKTKHELKTKLAKIIKRINNIYR